MSEIFPDGSIKKLDEAVAFLHQDQNAKALSLVGLVLAVQDEHRRTTVDPQMTIAILQGYLRAVFHFPVGNERVDDLICREDNKLYWVVAAVIGESKEALEKIEALRKETQGSGEAPPPPHPIGEQDPTAGALPEVVDVNTMVHDADGWPETIYARIDPGGGARPYCLRKDAIKLPLTDRAPEPWVKLTGEAAFDCHHANTLPTGPGKVHCQDCGVVLTVGPPMVAPKDLDDSLG